MTTHSTFDPHPSELMDESYKIFLEMVETKKEHLKTTRNILPFNDRRDEYCKEERKSRKQLENKYECTYKESRTVDFLFSHTSNSYSKQSYESHDL